MGKLLGEPFKETYIIPEHYGGDCSVLKLRNGKNTDQNFLIRPNKSGRKVCPCETLEEESV